MQQRFGVRRKVEIAGFVPVEKVGDEARAAGDVLAQERVVVGEEREPSPEQAREQDEDERREDALDTADVKRLEAEAPAFQSAEDDRRDQIAGDDEEDVDADESTGSDRREGMERHDRHDRERTEAVDIRPIHRMQGRNRRRVIADRTAGHAAPARASRDVTEKIVQATQPQRMNAAQAAISRRSLERTRTRVAGGARNRLAAASSSTGSNGNA